MFAGIVSAVGRIVASKPSGDGVRLAISAPGFGLDDVKLGDSIAIQGICHTVVTKAGDAFEVDTSRATLDVTTGLEKGRAVNLEKSLRLADRLGGHLVSGHVDGVGEVVAVKPVDENRELSIRFPDDLARYIARKGSVTVNGVSLTVNALEGGDFTINLIPHTLQATNLKDLKQGDKVNLEVDLVARYVERMLEGSN